MTTFRTYRGSPIELKPGVTPNDVTSPDEFKQVLGEKLWEKLLPLHGVKRILPANKWIGDYGNILPTDVEDEVIIFGHVPGGAYSRVMRAKISETNILKSVWSWDAPAHINMIDYIIELDRVLVPSWSDGKIWELDADTGRVLNTIDFGGDRRMWAITSIQESPRKALACRYDRHTLGEIDLDAGTWTDLFGVDGVAGDDLSHLYHPMDVEYFVGGDDEIDFYLVADTWNNRVLKIDASTKSVSAMYLIAGIGDLTARRDPVAESFNSRRAHIYNFDCAYCRNAFTRYVGLVPQGWVSALAGNRIQAFLPWDAGDKAIWSSPNSLWICYGEKAFELDLRYFKEPQNIGAFVSLVTNQSVSAEATYPPSGDQYATVLNGLHAGEIEVEIYSSQAATGYIDVPERRRSAGYEVDTGFSWVEYDSFTLEVGKTTGYLMTQPPNIFRVRVVMGATNGVVSIYYNKKGGV